MTIGSANTGGFYTLGVDTIPGSYLVNGRVPVDTGIASGSSPQSGAIIPGTLPAPSTQIGLTAQADGTKANATQLGYGLNTVTTVAGAADSLLLPYAFPGACVVVVNTVATAAQVFGKGTDTIDGVATATGIDIAASTRNIFWGVTGEGDGTDAGSWLSFGGAAA
jgi:hypothetical protein